VGLDGHPQAELAVGSVHTAVPLVIVRVIPASAGDDNASNHL
jgi:hypothetical protein